jgi:hypothetical protein
MPSDLGPSNPATAAPFAFGDVVLVPFPFTSQGAPKQRRQQHLNTDLGLRPKQVPLPQRPRRRR